VSSLSSLARPRPAPGSALAAQRSLRSGSRSQVALASPVVLAAVGLVTLCWSAVEIAIVYLELGVASTPSLFAHLMNWDAGWYSAIALHGYSWNPASAAQQSPNFFPLYPLLLSLSYKATGITLHDLAVGIAILFQVASAIVLWLCCAQAEVPRRLSIFFLVLFLVLPSSIFAIMGYYSSLFTFLLFLAVLAYLKGRPLLAALAIGFATATNPVGLAFAAGLFVVSAIRLWRASALSRHNIVLLGVQSLLSLSGIIAYAVFLWIEFDAPLAFYTATRGWSHPLPLSTELGRMATLTSIRHSITQFFATPFSAYAYSQASLLDAGVAVLCLVAIVALVARAGSWRRLSSWLLVASLALVEVQSARWGSEIGDTRYLLPVLLLVVMDSRFRRFFSHPVTIAVVLGLSLAGELFLLRRIALGLGLG
jgi:hypothetical protein